MRQILQNILHKTVLLRNNLRESIKETLNDLVIYYDSQGIRTANVYKLAEKVERIYKEWQSISKSRTSSTDVQLERREKFTKRLDEVFEIEKIE